MANQEARLDPNANPALIAHSSVSGTAETRQVVATNGQMWTTGSSYSSMMDKDNAGTIFIGYCDVGKVANVGSAIWAVKRIISEGGTKPLVSWAGGSLDRNNVWNNRVSLSYS